MTTVKQNLAIAGLNVDVFSDSTASSTEVIAFFLLHGRLSSSKAVESIAESFIQLTRDAQMRQRDLIVITFVGSCSTSMNMIKLKHLLTRIIAIMEPENWPPRLTRAGARMLN